MRARRGANAVEFALIAPILFGMLLSSIEFSWLMLHQLSLSAAVAEGAHVGAVTTRTQDSLAIATESASSSWAKRGLAGDVNFEARYDGDVLAVTGHLEYQGLTGIIGLSTDLSCETRTFLEP